MANCDVSHFLSYFCQEIFIFLHLMFNNEFGIPFIPRAMQENIMVMEGEGGGGLVQIKALCRSIDTLRTHAFAKEACLTI